MIAKVNIDMAGYFCLLKRTRCHLGAALVSLFLFGPGDNGAGAAEATPWTGMPETQARLIAASSAVGSAPRLTIGFQIRLAQGWKTYWRSPGDAGMPPQLDWSESQNLEDAEILWPAPKRFTSLTANSQPGLSGAVFAGVETDHAGTSRGSRLSGIRGQSWPGLRR